ncbi:fimbrial protein [Vibrio owensii]|uniref:fimbrial protein n=1 Tax=Vibrio owensii TaxID=696485 RepID=UPI00221E6199|nr:fimbrial protein [Vibrio owensii]
MKTVLAASVMAMALSSTAFAAEVAPVGGMVHFTGFITDSACQVNLQNNPFEESLDLGTFLTTDFAAAGDTSKSVPLNLSLTDCPTAVTGVTVRVTSTEGESTESAGDFELKSGGATGVALRLTEESGDAIAFGEESSVFPVDAGVGEIAINAQYVATKAGTDMTPGHADLDATFAINYK